MTVNAATPLRQRLETHVRAAFAAAGLDPAFGTVDVSRRPELSQFQANGAMAAAKAARKNPRELATAVLAALGDVKMIAKATVEALADPGVTKYYNDSGSTILDNVTLDKAREFYISEGKKFKQLIEKSGATAE